MSDLIIKKNGTDYKLPMLAEHYPADRVYLDGDVTKTVQNMIYYEDVTVTTDNNGYADIRTKAPIDKTISVNVIGSKRNSAYLWVNNDADTEFYAYVYERGASPASVANTSVTLRIWKRL